jgi:hypothetical protein
MKAAFFPVDIFQLEDLYQAYIRTQAILLQNWNQYPIQIRGFENWKGVTTNSNFVRPSTDSRYPPPVGPNYTQNPNGANIFQDLDITDNYFFAECVDKGQGLNASQMPGSPFPIQYIDSGKYFIAVLPTSVPSC